MAEATIEGLKAMLFMMIFYSVCVTLIAYMLPQFTQPYTSNFMSQGVNTNINEITSSVDLSVRGQTQLPLVDLGALLFYSGNLFIDLAVNFVTALPQMVVLAINIVMSIISPDAVFSQQIKLGIQSLLFVAYMFSLIGLLLNLRSGRGVQIK